MTLRTSLILAIGATLLAATSSHAGVVAGFDDLAAPPAVNGASGLEWAHGLQYKGIGWDANFTVVGDAYAVGNGGPLFGIPHSGHYFVTNHNGADGLMIHTSEVLTGAWFGRNQYYGFGEGGADSITIYAMAGAVELDSVAFSLPDSHPGQPEPLSFMDTSSFAGLTGITGYRIDRHQLGEQSGNWVADDFQFGAPRTIAEPASMTLVLAGLGLLALGTRRRWY